MLMEPNAYTTTGYQVPGQPVNKRAKILVIAMIVGILVLVIGGFLFISGQKDPNLAKTEQILAKHVEIARVSEKVLSNDSLSAEYRELAANAKVVAASHQNQLTIIIKEDYGSKVDKKLLASAADQANDDKLKQGELLGNVGAEYSKVLKQLLIETNKLISETGGNEDVKAQLDAMAKSNEEIFNSIPN